MNPSQTDAMVIFRTPPVSYAIDHVLDASTWSVETPTAREQMDALDRALDNPPPPPDLPARYHTAWLAAQTCEQLLRLDWLPEPARTTEALLHETLSRSGIRSTMGRLAMVMSLRAWNRSGRRDVHSLVDMMEETLEPPELPDPEQIDWNTALSMRRRASTPSGIVSGSPYEPPTYYVGDLSEIFELGSAPDESVERVWEALAAVLAVHPQPVAVGIVRSLTPTRKPSNRPRLPARADAHIVAGLPAEHTIAALDALQRKDGPKLILQGLLSDGCPARFDGAEPSIDMLGDKDPTDPAVLADWLYRTFESMIATHRRRLSHWVLELPRLLDLINRIDHASPAAIRRAEHRSGVTIGQMQRIVGGDTELLGDLPVRKVARLIDSLSEPAASTERGELRTRVEERINYGALSLAANDNGWDEATVTLLHETAKSKLIAADSDFRLELRTREDWVRFHGQLLGDQ
jgi:hypothetical protein